MNPRWGSGTTAVAPARRLPNHDARECHAKSFFSGNRSPMFAEQTRGPTRENHPRRPSESVTAQGGNTRTGRLRAQAHRKEKETTKKEEAAGSQGQRRPQASKNSGSNARSGSPRRAVCFWLARCHEPAGTDVQAGLSWCGKRNQTTRTAKARCSDGVRAATRRGMIAGSADEEPDGFRRGWNSWRQGPRARPQVQARPVRTAEKSAIEQQAKDKIFREMRPTCGSNGNYQELAGGHRGNKTSEYGLEERGGCCAETGRGH